MLLTWTIPSTDAGCCTVIKAIRAWQGRSGDFETYYRNLHNTYVLHIPRNELQQRQTH